MSGGVTTLGRCWCVALASTCITLALCIVLLGTTTRVTKVQKQQPRMSRAKQLLDGGNRRYTAFNSSLYVKQALKDLTDFQLQRLDQGCSCPRGSHCLLPGDAIEVKKHAYNRWQEREQILRPRPPLGLCPADSPLQFVASGIEMEPMQATIVVGLATSSSARSSLSFWDDDVKLTFKSGRGLGVLSLKSEVKVDVVGNNTKEMTLSENVRDLDAVLKGVIYQSTVAVYDDWDTINVHFLENVLNIHIRIRRKRLPYLYKTSSISPPIHERVTVIIKTFERYDQLNSLIDSVTKFYPAMTMIVADDSAHFQTVSKKNVLQYKMPPQTGWFAGRNLLVSQVMTEFLVWADDDFVFNGDTKLELFVEKLDKLELGLDLVSGYVGDRRGCGTCLQVGRDKKGPCVTVNRTCNHGPLHGYPQCVKVDRALNFFMARTRSVQEVGFDPHFNHIGHTEFFMDGYHSLRCACCSDVSVGHVPGGSSAFYKSNRNIQGRLLQDHQTYVFFKYATNCHEFV